MVDEIEFKEKKSYKVSIKACKICQHNARDEIEAAILMGQNYTDIARHTSEVTGNDINYQNISRHYRYHMKPPVQAEVKKLIERGILKVRNTTEELSGLFDQVEELIETVVENKTEGFAEINQKMKTLISLFGLKSRLIGQNKEIIQDVELKDMDSKTKDLGVVLTALMEKAAKNKSE